MKKRIIQEEIPGQAKHSESDKSLQPAAERILASESKEEEPSSDDILLKKENESEETNVSISGSTLAEAQELNTTNMA